MTDQYFKISVFFLVSRILLWNIGNPNPNNTHNGDARKQIPSSVGSDMNNSGNALNFSALFVKKKGSAHNTDWAAAAAEQLNGCQPLEPFVSSESRGSVPHQGLAVILN